MKCEIFHDNFQNYKKYGIPKAQLVIADIPYNIGSNAYASNPMWYQGGDNKNGESRKAKKSFFNSDGNFKIAEYMHFCSKLLRKEPREKGKAPAMIVFCAFDQIQTVVECGKKYGFMNHYPKAGFSTETSDRDIYRPRRGCDRPVLWFRRYASGGTGTWTGNIWV